METHTKRRITVFNLAIAILVITGSVTVDLWRGHIALKPPPLSAVDCSPPDCNDSNACTSDSCDTETGLCSNTSIDCADSNPCTDDGCDSVSGCYHNYNNNYPLLLRR
jgi:hypothetical protein